MPALYLIESKEGGNLQPINDRICENGFHRFAGQIALS